MTAREKASSAASRFALDSGDALIARPRPSAAAGRRRATGPSPRVAVRLGLEAELARPLYYELAEIALAEGHDPPGVWCDGAFFPLDAAMSLVDRFARRWTDPPAEPCSPATICRRRDGRDRRPRCWSRSPTGPSPA